MAVQVTTVMIRVESLDRSKKFYAEGLGCEIAQDYPNFVEVNLGAGSSSLALYPREAAAQDAGCRRRVPGSAASRSITSSSRGTPWTR